MRQLDKFRIYYNHTIHPELMRMERKRIRLLRLLILSGLLLLGVVLFEFYVNILLFTLVLAIPIVFYLLFLSYRIRKFLQTFKPNVMKLVLNFLQEEPNIGQLKYEPERSIPQKTFFESKLFACKPIIFEGEDFISGRVGEMDFDLCELTVEEEATVGTGLQNVFKGIFLHAIFPEETYGQVACWPRHLKHFFLRSIKEFTWLDAYNMDDEILYEPFREMFVTYASMNTHVAGILSEPMQESVVDYCHATGKELYFSFWVNIFFWLSPSHAT
ncbi:MAG: DUF3137 domain-containing protein [Haliscomenobacter sp.]|nr:DUF3137 domain-containing protein [Haliscomenobacter sp.]MBK9492890.1 DUF3137 domain-containing protein [Haliscomenobacter sp.]